MFNSATAAAGLVPVGFVILFSAPLHAAECHRYGATVTLAGRYAQAALVESPSGATDPQAVPGRTANLLILDVPLCVASDSVSRGVSAALDVQVLCPDRVIADGEAVSVTGRLVGAHTGNGHTPILLVCRS
jgi:hypothetical protein